ncbi:MAG: L-threonylcarbamoyladenylate synthase [Candidatus Omnitrophica bacterium]|nr:L-threonylcarbamoyladenylate synthase [Candidatus Omnitrophota bacterium]
MIKTELIKIDPQKPDKTAVKRAAQIIKEGGLVAFPTETVYGLGADYLNKYAVERLYEVKNRPRNKPFTVHIADLKMLDKLACRISGPAEQLIKKFWPGPLTLILNTKTGAKIGIRMPANKAALDFISACGTPIVAPSANISGNKPPTTAEEVLFDLDEKIEAILDGGKTDIGVESTVIDLTISPYKIIRTGAVSEKEIAGALTS